MPDLFLYPQPPFTAGGIGVRTPFGLMLPPGARVASYVHSSGPADGLDQDVNANIRTSLNSALALCRSGKGDYVIVLPGHAESIATADAMSNLVAGTNILCLGEGNNRPTFTWTADAATFLFDVANVTLTNAILKMAGNGTDNVTVAAPITVTAAGCAITGCRIEWGIDANKKVAIGVTTSAAGDDFNFSGNECYGISTAEATTFLRLVGADRFKMYDTVIVGATSSTTVGVVQFLTTASLDVKIGRCYFRNNKAASIHAVTGMAGATGIVHDCGFGILDNATLAGLVTPGDLMGFNNKTTNLAGEQGGLTTTVST